MTFVWNSCNALMKMCRKNKGEKGHFLYIGSRAILIATNANLLDTQ